METSSTLEEKLAHIVDVRSGVYAQPTREGDCVYLQMRHFDDRGQIRLGLEKDLAWKGKFEKVALQVGDVLLAARGGHFFAYAYRAEDPPAVPSTAFLVLRLNEAGLGIVDPAFLACFLNLGGVQAILQQQTQGSSMPSINKAAISDLMVSMPSLEKQRLIVKTMAAHARTQDLQKRLLALRDQELQQTIWKALNSGI